METVNIKINDVEYAVPANATVLEAARYAKVDIPTLCYLKDINDFAAFNAVYAEYFTEKPARSCVGGLQIPKGALVEVEVIAEL